MLRSVCEGDSPNMALYLEGEAAELEKSVLRGDRGHGRPGAADVGQRLLRAAQAFVQKYRFGLSRWTSAKALRRVLSLTPTAAQGSDRYRVVEVSAQEVLGFEYDTLAGGNKSAVVMFTHARHDSE